MYETEGEKRGLWGVFVAEAQSGSRLPSAARILSELGRRWVDEADPTKRIWRVDAPSVSEDDEVNKDVLSLGVYETQNPDWRER